MPPTDAEIPQAVGKPNPRNNATMFKIFQNVQYNVVQHKKYVKEMKKLYKKIDEESFRESFKNALQYLFTFGDTSANVDRVVQYVATFCTSLDDEEEFLLFIFDIIFECQCVSGQSVRYRASQLLAAVLSALGDDASLDDDLCDKLLQSQMQRLQDTRGAVRCRAALALQRLQNPMEPDDEVTRAYRFHMSCDPSSSVRRAIVMSIAKCSRNVPFVLERLCDVDEAVRRAAFLYIAANNVTQLRVRQRVLTLKVGLTERSPRVRRVVEEILIPSWLSTFKGNIIDLLKAIRLDNTHDAKDSEYVAGKLLESLFKRLPISELLEWLPTDKTLRLIPAEKLNKETAWYWRHLAEHLQKIDDDETLETILPDLVVLTGYIRAIVEAECEDDAGGTRQHVLLELARLLRVYDASDPPGRAALQALITDALTGDKCILSADVTRALVGALELVVGDVAQRMEVVCALVSSIRDSDEPEPPPPAPAQPVDCTELKLQRARLRVSLNVAMEAQEEAVREENYALAAECKAKVADIQKQLEDLNIQPAPAPVQPLPVIKEKQCDSATLNKCLVILNSALDTPQLTALTPVLRMIFTELESELFQNPDILDNALETVALYGMLDKEFARDHKAFFFANLVDTSNEPTVSTVLRCIVDLLCVHGAKVFEDDSVDDTKSSSRKSSSRKRNTKHSDTIEDDDGTLSESAISLTPAANSTVIELLLKIMDSACATYRLIIVEGLCRLLYLGHLESPAILSRLILLWFNPATVEEDMLRQTIGVFFQTFPSSVDGAQEQIQKATLPTLRALANAPSSSPIAEIDQEAVVKFIVSLTRINHELSDSQGALALAVAGHLRRAGGGEAALCCRLLALLSPPRDAALATQLATALRDLVQKIPDKQSCRNLTRYLGALEAMERSSINKLSSMGMITETSMPAEDTMPSIGRNTNSLPQPLARSTHVVINETVEEEVEIDETSPSEIPNVTETNVTEDQRQESDERKSLPSSDVVSGTPDEPNDTDSSDSSGVSPVKKAKITKGRKKKLSMSRRTASSGEGEKGTENYQAKEKDDKNDKGVKRSRSQRSRVDVDRAINKEKENELEKSPHLDDLDVSNVTVRRSTQPSRSGSNSDSNSSNKKDGNTKKEIKQKKGQGAAKATTAKSKKPELEKFLPLDEMDVSNVTVRRTTHGGKTSSNSDSNSPVIAKNKQKKVQKRVEASRRVTRSSRSRSSLELADTSQSADDTELHTIVYDNDFVQEALDDSTELNNTSKHNSKANVTVPESPEESELSESEPEPIPVKGKKKGKK
ncbi:condensin complex subunit 3 isoform X2 [Aricia agestis]|uniref:condensin complex subunit 3 isoform X2 n=1 Tax=Aricia agestis TaxID=91739 RepID=UPI001C20A25D|nr:condensin complex subunit 3 isoform X2 [Aricia agestis]